MVFASRSWPVVALVVSVASTAACAPSDATVADVSNMKCVSRLELPVYPPIAQSARVMGRLSAATAIAQGGAIQTITLEGASGTRPDLVTTLLGPAIERALKASRFDASCAGKTVRMTFVFGMDRQGAWFEFPNRFEIGAETPILNTSVGHP